MVLTTKHRMILYRRFRRDIWGYSYTDNRCKVFLPKRNNNYFKRSLRINKSNIYLLKSPYLKFFFGLWWRKRKMWRRKRRRYVYKFDRPPAFRKWRKYNKRFLSIRLTRLYFLTFQDHQFRKLFRSAAKMDGNFETNYLRFLESRAIAIVYRLNLSPDVFGLFPFIKNGNNFFLESCAISSLNVLIPIGQLIQISKRWHSQFSRLLRKRIKLRTLLFPTPKFLYSSYKFFFFYILRYPRRKDLIYPFAIDLQRITGYY